MNFLNEYLSEIGGSTHSFTVCIGSLAHFSHVKDIMSFSAERVVLKVGKHNVAVEGNNLTIDGFFDGDVIIHGSVTGVKIE